MVYFIRGDSFVKIGTTKDIFRRLSTLQSSCPEELECILLIRGSYSLEDELHLRFSESHHYGEWFHMSSEIREYVKEQKAFPLNDYSSLIQENAPSLKMGDNFSDYVRKLRKAANLSIRQVAVLLNLSKTSVASIEKSANPTLQSMEKLLRVYGASYTIK